MNVNAVHRMTEAKLNRENLHSPKNCNHRAISLERLVALELFFTVSKTEGSWTFLWQF